MLIDNKQKYGTSKYKSVWEMLNDRLAKAERKHGNFDIVTGFFTVSALDWLQKTLSPEFHYRMILGDITNDVNKKDNLINLLQNGDDILKGFEMKDMAKNAVAFLQRDNVEVKTVNGSFCHAKAYVYRDSDDDDKTFYVMGSSNLTFSGLGRNESGNVELNFAETGTSNEKDNLLEWFENQWKNVAQDVIWTEPRNPNSKKVDVKKYFIDEIENFLREFTPEDIYYKMLYEIFKSDIDIGDSNLKQEMKLLENSEIYKTLFEYQKKGVISLIKMLRKYNGAILADAVGLGKTFSALAVIKYFQNNGYQTLVLCPKKLQHNWEQYRRRQMSRFERDEFDYMVQFHTDLQADRLDNDKNNHILQYLQRQNKLLVVIDESHNLRNNKSDRFKHLMNDIIAYRSDNPARDVKVLELSATPINNRLLDVRNQFSLIGKGKDDAFDDEEFGINSLMSLFRDAENKFSKWCNNDDRKINGLIEELPDRFFRLTDHLIVARTRKLIERALGESLGFPKKDAPQNIYKSISAMGNYKSVEEIYDALMKADLSAYMPSRYLEAPKRKKGEEQEGESWQDNVYREKYLVRMMIILFMKRLESSWYSCESTIEKVLNHHKNALNMVNEFLEHKKNGKITNNTDDITGDDDDDEDFTLSKADVKLSDMKNIKGFKRDLEHDVKCLQEFYDNIHAYHVAFDAGEVEDEKLNELAQVIADKQKKDNKKVVVFTAYSDTAEFLYQQLRSKFHFSHIACVTGKGSYDDTSDKLQSNFNNILERFAPYSKLYLEKDWSWLYEDNNCSRKDYYDDDRRRWKVPYELWQDYVSKYDAKTQEKIDTEIDILIATDCLSEGQNLQDADLVINYDIHWNPVRLIQRFGRIDRIGSRNKTIGSVNFWPSSDYDGYLGLEKRIENRMASMKLIGSETQAINEKYLEMVKDNPLVEKNAKRLLDELKNNSLSDIEDSQSLSLSDLSLEIYRQDLLEYIERYQDKLKSMPQGAFSGFTLDDDLFSPRVPESLVAVVGYPRKKEGAANHIYTDIYLMCQPVDETSKQASTYVDLNRTQILEMLRRNKYKETFVPAWIDKCGCEEETKEKVKKLAGILQEWMKKQLPAERKMTLRDLAKGRGLKELTQQKAEDKDRKKLEDKFKLENFDLIAWEYISK